MLILILSPELSSVKVMTLLIGPSELFLPDSVNLPLTTTVSELMLFTAVRYEPPVPGSLVPAATVNVPLVLDQKIPKGLEENKKSCIVGLVAEPDRLADIRRNRVAIMKDHNLKEYTDLEFIKKEVEDSKKLFKKNSWPIIDVTRKSVEETAASILKIIEIKKNK